jgi:hypothetical protein
MKTFFTPNLQIEGRKARGVTSFVFLCAALVGLLFSRRLSLLLLVAGLFSFYEALRGWCVLRACGIKTGV